MNKACAMLLVLLCATLARAAAATTSAAMQLQVIPQPREAIAREGAGFDASAATVIIVSDSAEDRFAGRLLQETLRATHGVECDLVAAESGATHQLSLSRKRPTSRAKVTPPPQRESYAMLVATDDLNIAAGSDAGLFYGIQTLIQLLEQSRRENSAIPAMDIKDWPTFGLRGRYYDGSQYLGTIVPTRANLEREIKLSARFKLNFLCLEMYNLSPLKSFPHCADANTLSAGDWEYLNKLAHRYHVTLIPSFQSFAQIYQVIWNCEEGKPYREATCPGLICPSRPENVKFLQGIYRDLITTFKDTPILGIGCSEVGMQWGKKYCPLCQARIDHGETLQDIYSKHVRACIEAVQAAAKECGRTVRPMMWGDEFYMGYDGKRWVGIENIPRETVIGHWMYWKPYNGIAGLLDRGYDVLFLSATYQHNAFLVDLSPQDPSPAEGKWAPLVDSGVRNVVDQAREAAIAQQKSTKGKVLGGGCATFSQHDLRCWDTTWLAYALQAQCAWGEAPRDLDDILKPFIEKFVAIFYGTRDADAQHTIASAYAKLDAVKSDIERNNYLIRDVIGIFDVQDVSYTDNTLENSLNLIDDLAAHPKGPGNTIPEICRRAENGLQTAAWWRQKFADLAGRVDNVASLNFLVAAARKIENHCNRTLFLLDLDEGLRKAVAADANSRQRIAKELKTLQQRCDALIRDTQELFDETFPLTHGARLAPDGNDSSGYAKAIASLQGFNKRLKKSAEELMSRAQIHVEQQDGRLTFLSWDTEGGTREEMNLLRKQSAVRVRVKRAIEWQEVNALSATVNDGQLKIAVRADALAGAEEAELTFPFDPLICATTIYPSAWNADGTLRLPAIISAPDFGQMRIAASNGAKLKGRLVGSRANHTVDFTISLPRASAGESLTLTFEPVRLPAPAELNDVKMWPAARRGWFNAIQPSAQWGDAGNHFSAPAGILANNVVSDPVSCLMGVWADQILLTPSFDNEIKLAPLVERTVDWWLDERTKPTGEVIAYWDHTEMLDANASPLIAAWDYVETSGDREWLARRIEKLEFIANYLVQRDVDGDGLIESVHSGNAGTLIEPKRAGSAYDTINAGHKDAYCNALIYRAFRCLADLEKQLSRADQQAKYTARADRLKSIYATTFLNPATGWLAWWKSEDGQLHDLASPMINSLAICYGLVTPQQGREILDRLWAKLESTGFHRFDLGVPITLVPVPRGDYLIGLDACGVPKREDGSDTFGQYLNGGCMVSDACYLITALHIVGDGEKGDRILHAMVDRQQKGVFSNGGGFQNGVINAWPHGAEFYTWDGTTCGYEGHLTYSYAFLQAILLREPQLRAKLYRPMQ